MGDPDPLGLPLVDQIAGDSPWLHPLMIAHVDHGIAVVALLLAGRWTTRRSGGLAVMATAMWAIAAHPITSASR
jgi:hypothetical protein